MKIPNLNFRKISDENGNLTDEAFGYLSILTELLQNNLMDEGYFIPQQPEANIEIIDTPLATGSIVYDSTSGKFKGSENGVFRTFSSTLYVDEKINELKDQIQMIKNFLNI